MNLKNFDKAQKIYSEIKALDAEIIEIEKLAQVLAGGARARFSLSCDKPADQVKGSVLTSDGSLRKSCGGSESGGIFSFSIVDWGRAPKKPTKPKISVKQTVPETLALQLLGVLVQNKQDRRKLLSKSLEKLTTTYPSLR